MNPRLQFFVYAFVFLVAIGGLYVGYVNLIAPAPGAAGGLICSPGSQPQQVPCVTATGQIGTKTQMCTLQAGGQYGWQDMTGCSGTGGGVAPTTTTIMGAVGPALVCRDSSGKVSYSVQVEDSLDDEAAPITRLSNITIYLDTSENTGTSSSTGGVTMSTACIEKYVTFIAVDDDNSGNDIYPVDTVVLTDPSGNSGVYGPNQVPTFYIQNGVKYGHVIAPVTMKAGLQGNISITVWDSSGTATDTNLSVTTDLGGSNAFTKILFKEAANDKMADGIVLMVDWDYNTTGSGSSGLKDMSITCPTGYSVVRDDSAVNSDNSSYDRAWRIYKNGVPLRLDQSDRTPDVNSIAECSIDIQPQSDCTGGFHILYMAKDSLKQLDASTAKLTWRGNGAYYTENINYNDVGIANTQEGSQSYEIYCGST